MNRQGRILIVDDDARWRDVLADILQRGGFQVDSVATTAQALRCLFESFYHLVTLDIRFEESDPNSVQGMVLLRELNKRGIINATEIIMLTAFGTIEQMREAFSQYKVADFFSKAEFDAVTFVERVKQVFDEYIRINLDLSIHWEESNGAEQVVLDLKLDGTHVMRDTLLQQRAAAELDDLLCRLFHEAHSLVLKPWSRGTDKTGMLLAEPFDGSGAGQTVLVKFGDATRIEKEHDIFKTHVESQIGRERSTTVFNLRRTPLLGGIAYSLLGAADELPLEFGDFYRGAEIAQIRAVLDELFLSTCGAWYANLGPLQSWDLADDYQRVWNLKPEQMQKALLYTLKLTQDRDQLGVGSLDRERGFSSLMLSTAGQHLTRITYVCTTHGHLNEHNILVDTAGHCWLIDFANTGLGHVLRDIAALDSVVRLGLLAPQEATLEERLQMEEALSSAERFTDVERLPEEFLQSTTNQTVAKAFSTVVHLRSLARRLVAQNPSDDISELYIALFYYALNTLRSLSLPTLQREHALLSASLLSGAIQGLYHKRYSELEAEIVNLGFQSKGRFQLLTTASHELKRPLSKVKAVIEDILAGDQGELNDKQKHWLTQAVEHLNREFRMIEKMLNLTSLEAGMVKAELLPCSVVDCIRSAMDDNRQEIEIKQLELSLDLATEGVKIAADTTLLTGAFSNLLENAIKFTAARGKIGIRCWFEYDWVQIEISDTGIGIPKEALPFIFDSFFQADQGPARRFGGLGAGLHLTRDWLGMHGGTIDAESEVGKGTSFRIRLPVHRQVPGDGA